MSAVSLEHTSESVELLSDQISTLVRERQRMRASGGDEVTLEQNRREIADLQQRLSKALIQRYRHAAA